MSIIKELLIEWSIVYLILICCYFLTGLSVIYLNQFFPKIQNKLCQQSIIRRDIIQSVRSLLSIALFFSGGILLYKHGYGIHTSFSFLFLPLSFIYSMILFDTWFYWGHRLLHHKFLMKRIHRWHHSNKTPTVWSNNSDTFLDNCILQSYFLVAHLICPIHPYVLLMHKIFDQVTGMIGHSGHEYASGRFEVSPFPFIGVTFHDQHHQFFNYNFATHFSFWDRMMGTLYNEYEPLIKKLTSDSVSRTTLC